MSLPVKAESKQSKGKGEARATAPLPPRSPGNTELTSANQRAGPDHMIHTLSKSRSDFLDTSMNAHTHRGECEPHEDGYRMTQWLLRRLGMPLFNVNGLNRICCV